MLDRTIVESMETYPVVLLVEQALSAADAAQVRSLHEELVEEGQQVSYHVLLPIHDAAARIEAAMGSLAGGELLTSPAVTMSIEVISFSSLGQAPMPSKSLPSPTYSLPTSLAI